MAELETVREQLLQSLDQYAKLLAGDTSLEEPDEARIQQLVSCCLGRILSSTNPIGPLIYPSIYMDVM